ncbi:hypothetical protein TNCV_2019111 [Trichonephila clavipes]|nr:hypothetical protein TNCV_2019111 [Trichonephila clavipes]
MSLRSRFKRETKYPKDVSWNTFSKIFQISPNNILSRGERKNLIPSQRDNLDRGHQQMKFLTCQMKCMHLGEKTGGMSPQRDKPFNLGVKCRERANSTRQALQSW